MRNGIGYLCTMALLAYHSVFDVKEQHIPQSSLAVGAAVSGCWSIGKALLGNLSCRELLFGLIPGAVVLLLAAVTREQVGYGDGWELLIMGCWLGWADCLLGLGIALVGVFCVSVILLLFRKVRGSSRIPFVPFLCMGTMLAALLRLIG